MAQRMRTVAIAALRAGDDGAAQVILDAVKGLGATLSGLVTEQRPMTSTERSRLRRQRLNATPDATDSNVACNATGNVASVALEGDKGGGFLGISRDSLENETTIQGQNLSPGPSHSLSQPGRARAKATRGTRIPEDFAVTPELEDYCAKNRLPDPHVEIPKMVRHFRTAPGAKGIKLEWPLVAQTWMRNAMDRHGAPPWSSGPQYAAAVARTSPPKPPEPPRDMVRVDPAEVEAQLAALTSSLTLSEAS